MSDYNSSDQVGDMGMTSTGPLAPPSDKDKKPLKEVPTGVKPARKLHEPTAVPNPGGPEIRLMGKDGNEIGRARVKPNANLDGEDVYRVGGNPDHTTGVPSGGYVGSTGPRPRANEEPSADNQWAIGANLADRLHPPGEVDLAKKFVNSLAGDRGAAVQKMFYQPQLRRAMGINDTAFRMAARGAAEGDKESLEKLQKMAGVFEPEMDTESLLQLARESQDPKERQNYLSQASKSRAEDLARQKASEVVANATAIAREKAALAEQGKVADQKRKEGIIELRQHLKDTAPPGAVKEFDAQMKAFDRAIATSRDMDEAEAVVQTLFKDASEPAKDILRRHAQEKTKNFDDTLREKNEEQERSTQMKVYEALKDLSKDQERDPQSYGMALDHISKWSNVPVEELKKMGKGMRKIPTSEESLKETIAQDTAQAFAVLKTGSTLTDYQNRLIRKALAENQVDPIKAEVEKNMLGKPSPAVAPGPSAYNEKDDIDTINVILASNNQPPMTPEEIAGRRSRGPRAISDLKKSLQEKLK